MECPTRTRRFYSRAAGPCGCAAVIAVPCARICLFIQGCHRPSGSTIRIQCNCVTVRATTRTCRAVARRRISRRASRRICTCRICIAGRVVIHLCIINRYTGCMIYRLGWASEIAIALSITATIRPTATCWARTTGFAT